MGKLLLLLFVVLAFSQVHAQTVTGASQANGLSDSRATPMAIVHTKVWITPDKVVEDGMLMWQNGRITYAGPMKPIAADVVVMDAKGKTIYPAFVEMISDFGLVVAAGAQSNNRDQPDYYRENGANKYWNEHIRAEVSAATLFKYNDADAGNLRKMGFAYALTHVRDGMARGTGALVALAPEKPNVFSPIVKAEAAACYSFQRAKNSNQAYPNSLMGSIALLRQMYLDAKAYQEGISPPNATLVAVNKQTALPQLFEAGTKLNLLRADKLGKEAGRTYIYRSGGDEYQRLDAIKRVNAPLIVPVNLPKPYDVSDPIDADALEITDLMHAERAPFNLSFLQKAGIKFAVTTDGLKDKGDFWPNLRKTVKCGLAEQEALRALTQTPAKLVKVEADLGSLEPGRQASFVITDKSLFVAEGKILETWVAGTRYAHTDAFLPDYSGVYKLKLGTDSTYTLTLTRTGEATLKGAGAGADTAKRKVVFAPAGTYMVLTGKFLPDSSGITRLGGLQITAALLQGEGALPTGKTLPWSARRIGDAPTPPDTARFRVEVAKFAQVPYPFSGFGWTAPPNTESILYRNATVWTNEAGGKMEGADVWVNNGKIAAVGRGLAAPAGARVEDATGKHITPGIIDEHSHIGINGGVNECSHSVTAECRIGDVVNSEDVNIYRHLAAGVVAVQQLHGSCNSIGGQSSLVKMRWGMEPEQMKIEGADGFIKCALGENVKQSNWGTVNNRYPQTRMGVEQVFRETFARALAYRDEQKSYASLTPAEKKTKSAPRRDLQLETVLEIVEKRRFISCHSYVASEILMLMRVADSLGFRVNTFTHILEGYKVAEQMKKHGAGASTFSDWWYYKMEVQDAIPYNAALMHNAGITVAINSDDAEMARRLNQEAAKTIRYGGLSEEDALRTITLNPAKLLHLDNRMGSIKAGKDADIVLWDKHPFAPGAKPLQTLVDGKVLFDIKADAAARERIAAEKLRLIKANLEARGKGPTQPAGPGKPIRMYHCEDTDGRDESWGG